MSDWNEPRDNEINPEQPEETVPVISVWKGSGNTRLFRRRYFDGFTFYETLDEKGKRVMHNVYTGFWYTQELSRTQRNRNRAAYVLLFLLGAALLLLGATRVIPVNSRPYGALPAFVGLAGFVWMLVAVCNEFTVPQRRTIGEYRASSLALQRSGLLCAISCTLLFLLTVIFAFVNGTKPGAHALAAGCELLAAAAGFLVRYLESRVEYSKKVSEDAGKYEM